MMDIRVLTLILLVSNCQCFLWNKVTPTPGPDVLDVGACPARRCSLKVNRTFSCPFSGCLNISDQIRKDTRIIRLQDNNITYIQRLAFPELTTLDLADNKISVINQYAFQSLTKLKALYLSNNLITTLAHEEHTYFATLIDLEFLHISQNRLTQIGPGIFYPYLPNLKTLDLSYNNISIITSDCISDMVSLEEVKLNNNILTNVTGRLHNLPMLRSLYLNQNKIKDLGADTFSDLPCLQTLDLSFNQISVIDDDTFTLGNERSQLELLNLKHNNIKVLNPQIFSRLASLKTLYLDYNSLIDIPAGVFPASLQTLTMSNMVELRIVHRGAFQSLRNIRTIEMANNRRLTLIQAGAFDPHIRDVSMIDLSGNNLAMLQEEVLQDWNEIESVDLSRNPWHCDCNMAWMLKVYMQPDDRHAIRCHTPARLSGKPLTEVGLRDLSCGGPLFSVRQRAGITLIILLSVGFLGFMAVFMYRYRRNVFPCWYGQTSDYRALYNVTDPDDATLRITVNEAEKKMLRAMAKDEVPEPVAL